MINASSQWESALLLSRSGNYGLASSILIISIEEYLKGLIVFLESKGFKLLKLDGISQLFRNHEMRYFLSSTLFVLYLTSQELITFFQRAIQNEIDLIALNNEMKLNPDLCFSKFKFKLNKKIVEYKKEFEWFEKIDDLRQLGFYTDYKDGILSPQSISEQQFEILHHKLSKVKYIISSIIEFVENGEVHNPKLIKVYKRLDASMLYTAVESMLRRLNKKPFVTFMSLLNEYRKL